MAECEECRKAGPDQNSWIKFASAFKSEHIVNPDRIVRSGDPDRSGGRPCRQFKIVPGSRFQVPGCAVQQLFRGIGSKVKAEIKVKICGITSFKRSVQIRIIRVPFYRITERIVNPERIVRNGFRQRSRRIFVAVSAPSDPKPRSGEISSMPFFLF